MWYVIQNMIDQIIIYLAHDVIFLLSHQMKGHKDEAGVDKY